MDDPLWFLGYNNIECSVIVIQNIVYLWNIALKIKNSGKTLKSSILVFEEIVFMVTRTILHL